jgi:hypothetical protein
VYTTDSVICIDDYSDVNCFSANASQPNETISFNSFVIWYNGESYNTASYLPNLESGDVTYTIDEVELCFGKINCYNNLARVDYSSKG